MKNLISAVRQSYIRNNPYAALALALSLPDIAGDYQYPETKIGSQRYINWFNNYVKPKRYERSFRHYVDVVLNDTPKYEWLSGEDCYALRCSLLHNGSDNISNQSKRKTLNSLNFNNNNHSYLHCCMDDKKNLFLNVKTFCEDICSSVEKWLEDNKENLEIMTKVNNMFKIEVESQNGLCT